MLYGESGTADYISVSAEVLIVAAFIVLTVRVLRKHSFGDEKPLRGRCAVDLGVNERRNSDGGSVKIIITCNSESELSLTRQSTKS